MKHIKAIFLEDAFCSPMTAKLCDFIKKPYKIFCFNVARCYAKNVNYNLLENLKDGQLVSTKYEGNKLSFPNPHVLVFSNEHPD